MKALDNKSAQRPTELRCEGIVNPVGIDERAPGFSWRVATTAPSAAQTAYRILVASSVELLTQGVGDLWDSGKVLSSHSVDIPYRGTPLTSRQRCAWKVELWDEQGIEGLFSDPASFEMGLLNKEEWAASWIGWIGGSGGKALDFRCSFSIPFEPCRARFYIVGLGYYEAFVNGQRQGKSVLNPLWTDVQKTILYSAYDVTACLHRGENVLATTVGPGWYGNPSLLGQLEVYGTGGEHLVVSTGRDKGLPEWLISPGPILSTSIYDGEVYDARLEKQGWMLPGYDPEKVSDRPQQWLPGYMTSAPAGKLKAQIVEPIQVVRELSAKTLSQPLPSVFVYDFGQNHAGWVRIRVKGPRGTRVTFKYSETLHPDGTVNQENLRRALATDTYILKGGEEEQWEPRFTYHGYRYVQVEGWPGVPDLSALVSCVVRNAVEDRGRFECDHSLFNRIHQMIRRTEESNLHGVPTDCPQRDERMGWLNDLAGRSEELVYNFAANRFLEKFINDIANVQDEGTGAISDTVPFLWGYRPADPVSACYLLMPFLCYQHSRNIRLLESHYEGFRSWVDFLTSQTESGIVNYSHYGDWCPPANFSNNSPFSTGTPGKLVSTAYYCYSLHLLTQISKVLGYVDNEKAHQSAFLRTREQFHKEYWREDGAGYGSGNQACNAMALYFDLVPDGLRSAVVSSLVHNVQEHDYHLTTGNLTTKYLFEVLSQEGHGETAFKMAAQKTYPSWGYMLENGATTLWERWELLTGTGMNSHNHPMLGAVDAWFYRWVAGITIAETISPTPHFVFRVPVFQQITSAHGSLKTEWGTAAVDWKRQDRHLQANLQVPWNCTATVSLPGSDQELTSGSHAFSVELSPQQLSPPHEE
jgi:alpha-L-rhamnosidase